MNLNRGKVTNLNATCGHAVARLQAANKLFRIMKITVFIILSACLGASASGYSQTVTLSANNAPLETVLKSIRQQTGYNFLYTESQLKEARKVTIQVKDVSLEEALRLCFSGQPFTYDIIDRTIVVKNSALNPPPSEGLGEAETPPITIKGRVTNEAGEPIERASVTVKGTSIGTSTDASGYFELKNVDAGATIVISGVSIETMELKIPPSLGGGQGEANLGTITVKIKATESEAVIINAGYYKVRKEDKTGSISKVDAKTIEKQPVTNPLAAISGRMPGVYVQQASGTPGGDFRIQIRGRNSLRPDGNEPLYIIDGVPFSTEKTFSSHTTTGAPFGTTGAFNEGSQVSPLTSLNMADIESIEILKDADATAIYGSRGANGVVLITTKKGRSGKTKFDLNVYTGVGSVRKVDLLSRQQFLAFRREAFANDGLIPSANPNDNTGANGKLYSPELMVWDTARNTDWQEELLGTAQSTSVQSSISGGSEYTQFLFSLGYRKENSIYSTDLGYQKGSFHMAVNHKSLNKKFSVSINLNGAKDNNDQVGGTGLSEKARRLAPNAPQLYDVNGKLNWENSTWQNPLAEAEMKYRNDVVNFTGNTLIGYEILPNLQFKASFGASYLHSEERTKKPSTYYDPAMGYTSAQSTVVDATGTNQSWTIEPQLNWERKIAKGNLTILIGSTFQEQQLQRKADFYEGFPSDELLSNLSSATRTLSLEYVQSLYRYMAVFGRLNYNWQGKYILNLTGRRDASSRFGPGRQFATFAATGAAWIFSKEKWVEKNIDFLSFGKLRASYGTTGSDQIGNYQYLDTYGSGVVGGNQYQGVTFLSPLRLFNANYSWETNKKFEVALELGLFKDRILLTSSYFRNRSSNQLVNYTLPETTGFSGILANLPATVQNTGWEGELTTVNLAPKSKLQWATSFNITIPRNKLVEFPNIETSTYANIYEVGKPLFILKVFESTGVDPQTGLWTFRDVNGDGIISSPADNAKAMFRGQYFFGGLNNSITYKSWSLDVFFQFVKQTGLDQSGFAIPGTSVNIFASTIERRIWRKPGDMAEIQRLSVRNTFADIAYQNYKNSDANVVNASFVRLKNVSLSYQLPKKWAKGFNGRIYFQGQNLLLITKYNEDDPEVLRSGSLAPLRMFTTGVQFTL